MVNELIMVNDMLDHLSIYINLKENVFIVK